MASNAGLDFKDYYKVLGVPKTASQAEVKKAFRKLARQHHPDAKPGDTAAERRFKEINEANEVLSDPAKRAQYDELGANWASMALPSVRARPAALAPRSHGPSTRPPRRSPSTRPITGRPAWSRSTASGWRSPSRQVPTQGRGSSCPDADRAAA